LRGVWPDGKWSTEYVRPAKIGRDVAKALIAERHDGDARATLAMELRSLVSVVGFFADGAVVVNIGSGRWYVLIERGEVIAVKSGAEDAVPPIGTLMAAEFLHKIERMPSGGKIDQAKIDRRLSSAASHRTSTK
jgi:hypothetical protein